MMDPQTGEYRMIEPGTLRQTLDTFPTSDPAGPVLVHGTEEQIAGMARRIALGGRELDKRAARRRQQRASRRRNR